MTLFEKKMFNYVFHITSFPVLIYITLPTNCMESLYLCERLAPLLEFHVNVNSCCSSSKFYFQQNTTIKQ